MKYYKNEENAVYAYDDECLSQVAALTVLESLISEKEPELTDADSRLRYAEHELNEAKNGLTSYLRVRKTVRIPIQRKRPP
ncbi:hypothetical protein UA45_15290 [Morganella morganii]|uniref:Uncharacterized protein n=1 Tax=Morganella morganii TaxID=582 RepID=A0A0D8L8B6_MORMO|nr:hypothetical protein UA45_15290 [Morganella morganii]